MDQNLSTLTKKQLEKLQKDVQKALKSIADKERREAKKAAEKAAAKFGFSLSELTDNAPAAKKAAKKTGPKPAGVAKFANPDNPSQKWTGKGRQPQWYKDAIAAGVDSDSMKI